jgi:hypothetical protein
MWSSLKTIVVGTKDIILKVNQTIWTSGENAERAASIAKTSGNLAGAGISSYNAAEDAACGDQLCFILSCVGATCDVASILCGNIPIIKGAVHVTVPVSVACKSTRFYCKKFGQLPGCK